VTDSDETFDFVATGGGTPRGGLADPSAVTVHLDGVVIGDDRARRLFRDAIHRQRAALSAYLDALEAAGGDITAPDVQDASAELHDSLGSLPVAHTAYAGTGFASPRYTASEATGNTPVTSRARGSGIHPDMHTAILGDTSQRWDLAGAEDLPLAVEMALATDPDPQVRSSFVMGISRSRTAVLLMEQREDDPDVLRLLARQRHASPDRKLPLQLWTLVPRELEGLYEILGLDDRMIEAAHGRWARAQEHSEEITVEDALREIGWRPGRRS